MKQETALDIVFASRGYSPVESKSKDELRYVFQSSTYYILAKLNKQKELVSLQTNYVINGAIQLVTEQFSYANFNNFDKHHDELVAAIRNYNGNNDYGVREEATPLDDVLLQALITNDDK